MGTFRARVIDHLVLPARVSLVAGEERSRRRAGRTIPAAVALQMVIDTGASRTSLIPGILRHLDTAAYRHLDLHTASGTRRVTLHWVRLDFPETRLAAFSPIAVAPVEMPPALAGFHGLIGRDVLRGWEEWRYQGRRGRYLIRDAPGLLGWLRRWL